MTDQNQDEQLLTTNPEDNAQAAEEVAVSDAEIETVPAEDAAEQEAEVVSCEEADAATTKPEECADQKTASPAEKKADTTDLTTIENELPKNLMMSVNANVKKSSQPGLTFTITRSVPLRRFQKKKAPGMKALFPYSNKWMPVLRRLASKLSMIREPCSMPNVMKP